MNARLADFSGSDFSGAKATMANFERASLRGTTLDRVEAAPATFEFADLQQARMSGGVFNGASFVGACLSEAEAVECDFDGADFYWAEMKIVVMRNCSTKGARFPEKVMIAYRPKGVTPPDVKPVALYRRAATLRNDRS
jgi:uncharacterized protein YjbI with pentapeptide repeats